MDHLEYKGYKGSVEYSKEDNCLFGKVQGMSKDLIIYEGQTLEELRKDFEAGVDSYLEGCKADGVEPAKPYSGLEAFREIRKMAESGQLPDLTLDEINEEIRLAREEKAEILKQHS